MGQVEDVHALVEQLAAAGVARVGTPLALVPDPPAVPVARAESMTGPWRPEPTSAARPRDGGVEAVVEADLDEAPVRSTGRAGDPIDLDGFRARAFSTRTCAQPQGAGSGAQPAHREWWRPPQRRGQSPAGRRSVGATPRPSWPVTTSPRRVDDEAKAPTTRSPASASARFGR